MRKLTSFTFISLDGFYKDIQDGISWHRHGEEENKFSAENLKAQNILLFGRITYELMASWWPSPAGIAYDPVVAKGMNESEKIVFSRTLETVRWENSRLIKDNIGKEIKKLKQLEGRDMAIMGSGTIVTQLAEQGLIDEYQFMIDPVALGEGTSLFSKMKKKLDLNLISVRTFKSGTVLCSYAPAK